MKYIAILLLITACHRTAVPPKPVSVVVKPPPSPVNLICKKFLTINTTARCEPELTDDGPTHIYTATVTLYGQQLACRQDTTILGMLCGDPLVIKQQPPPLVEDKKPAKR